MQEFISLTVKEIVLHHEVRYSGDTDDGSITHLSLTMILRTVVEEIIDGQSPDFVTSFLDIVQVQLLEMIDNGRLVRTHKDDVDCGGANMHTHTQTCAHTHTESLCRATVFTE